MGGQQAYSFSGDPFEVFENFFGTSNPFHIVLNNDGQQVKLIEKIESDIHKEADIDRVDNHAPDLCINVQCTLKEFFYGCLKTVTASRELCAGDGKSRLTEMVRK